LAVVYCTQPRPFQSYDKQADLNWCDGAFKGKREIKLAKKRGEKPAIGRTFTCRAVNSPFPN